MTEKISSPAMIQWQLDRLTGQLMLVGDHYADQTCPCTYGYSDPSGKYVPESCIQKHLLAIYEYSAETIPMIDNEELKALLSQIAEEARGIRNTEMEKVCGKEVEQTDITGWARDKRKLIEPHTHEIACAIPEGEKTGTLDCCSYRMKPSGEVLLTCRKDGGVLEGLYPSLEDAKKEAESFCKDSHLEEIAQMFKKKAEPRWCYPVKETDKELGKLSRTLGAAKKRIAVIQRSLEMPLNICRGQAEMFESTTGVLDPYGSRCRDPETGHWVYSEECGFEPAGITTTALGMDGLTRYEFEFKLVSLDKLVVSHDPFTFTPNPNYPKELQPRLRERAATKIQVEKIAANLEPDAVITDFHVIDRGTPIVGPDLVVEAGNGRVMGIIKAAADHPDKYIDYKDRLRERARDYGLSAKDVDLIDNPILIRVRITDVDRTTFTQEANQAATIAPSAIENARTDAQKITIGMLQELVVGEKESLEDALRAPKNQAFAKRFLATLPETVQAALVDAQGYLNRDGVHRMAMAVFVSAFQGDPGLRLAEKAFESVDMDVRNTVNAIARSLGPMAQAEALTRTGERDTALSIGDDLAQTINVYSAIKRNPALTVEKYMAQEQIFARELTPFQERILVVLDEYKRAPRKLASIFTAYAEGVISAPPPAQAALIPGVEITKEGLWESAVKAPEEQPALIMEVIKMFDKRGNGSGAEDEVLKAMVEANLSDIAKFTPSECRHVGAALNALVTASREVTDLVTNKRLWRDKEVHDRHWQIYNTISQASRMIDDQMETYCSIGEAKLKAPMKLLTKEIRAKLPPLYSQEKVQDPMVWVKFFTPDSNWTWYATEFDGEDRFFGWVVGFEKELGYFSLKELESARGPMGLAIERDKWFTPQPLSEVKKLHQHERGELAQGTMAAIGSAATTGAGIAVGFRLIDWLAKKFSEKESKEGEMGDDIIDRIAQRYRELEIIKRDTKLDEKDIAHFDGQQSGLLWVGYRIDEPRMIKTVAREMGTKLEEGERATTEHFCLSGDAWFELQDAIGKGEKQKAMEIMWSKGMKLVLASLTEEGYEPSIYATRRFDKQTYIFYKHVSSDKEAMKLVNQLYENWKVLAIATPDNDIWVPKKDAPLLISPEFLKRAGLKEEAPYARQIPDYIEVWETTIEKHYRPSEDFHEGSIRVVKPEPDVLVYLGCLKGDEWDAEAERCSPNPTVVMTIVPNNKKYRDEMEHLKLVHPEVRINYRTKEVGVEPVVSEEEQQELEAVEQALEHSEEVS